MSRVEMCRKALNLGRKHELERIWRAVGTQQNDKCFVPTAR